MDVSVQHLSLNALLWVSSHKNALKGYGPAQMLSGQAARGVRTEQPVLNLVCKTPGSSLFPKILRCLTIIFFFITVFCVQDRRVHSEPSTSLTLSLSFSL